MNDDYSNKPNPFNFTKHLSSKSESASRLSEISEDSSSRQMIEDIRNKSFTRTKRQARIILPDQTNKSIEAATVTFKLTKSDKALNDPCFSDNLMKTIRVERMKNQFINNLFTNSYIMKQNKKQLIHQKYIKEGNKTPVLETYTKSIVPVISPTSVFVVLWDAVGTISNFIMLWLAPFLMAFQDDSIQDNFNTFGTLITVFLVSDIFVTLNKGIIIQGIVIKKRRKIIQQYVKSNAFHDIVNLCLWILIQHQFNSYNGLREALTIGQVFITYIKIQKYISDYFQYVFFKGASSYLMDLITLIFSIYFFAHIAACCWYYIGERSAQIYDKSWILKYEINNQSIMEQYNYAFYWATMTMTTVGYGDITAQSHLEIIFVDLIMFLSSGIFAYSMNSIGMILKNLYDAKIKYQRSLLQMNTYMSKNQVDQQIQSRIRNYLKFYIEAEQNENLDDVNRLISILPSNLQQDLNTDIQTKVINRVKMVINHFSKSTQNLLSKNLELVKFTPGDIIFKKGDSNDQYLYFILDGEVQFCDDQTQMQFQKISNKQAFGIYQFFTNYPPKTSAISIGFSNIYRISRLSFLEILQFNKKDFEKFHQIKDQIIFQSNYRVFDLKCQVCDRYTHQEVDCPVLRYKPDIEQRFKKESYRNNQNKRQYIHRKDYKINSLITSSAVQSSVCGFREETNGVEGQNSLQLAIIAHRSKSGHYSDIDQKKSSIGIVIGDEEGNQLQLPDSTRKISKWNDSAQSPNSKISQQEISIKRQQHHEMTVFGKEYNMLEDLQLNSKFIRSSFQTDQVQCFQSYFPTQNVDVILNQAEKQNKKYQKKLDKFLENMNKYTFFYKVKLVALKLKLAYQKQIKNS